MVFLSSLIITKIFLLYKNTLENNSNWHSSKLYLQEGVMGSNAFYENTQALDKEKLNLGAWHGFQEVMYVDQVNPRYVDFDFLLTKDSYFYFIFNKNMNVFSAIRISNNSLLPNQFVKSLVSGEFIKTKDIDIPNLKHDEWNHASIIFNNDHITLQINQDFSIDVKVNIFEEQLIGFRGSLQNSFIDNISINNRASSKIINENFSNFKNWKIIFVIVFSIMMFIDILFFTVFFKYGKRNKKLSFLKLFILNFVIISMSLAYSYFAYFYFLGKYPNPDSLFSKLKFGEDIWIKLEEDAVNRRIMEKYSHQTEKFRILFIGSSQTKGAGVLFKDETFVRLVENRVNSDEVMTENEEFSVGYELINAGASGAQSKNLLELYKNNWINLKPDLVVINLSNNDAYQQDFGKNLQEFVDINKEKNIETIFFLEANSPEKSPSELIGHHIMREVAQKNNIKYFDIHSYLMDNIQSGIIWWDQVHMTSYGHKLVADFFYDAFLKHN